MSSLGEVQHPWADAGVPSWATQFGEDRFGVWCALEVAGVSQRMRWIPGGRFVMGSPEGEAGRRDNEQQHEVELGSYWLGETPVTQELWHAVTGENPSDFVSPTRPVENVNWDDCQAMTRQLNEQVSGLAARLPTEAEWEYACRAGTEFATYAGALEILGEHNAPVLDAIAWYGGNSGVGYDLEHGGNASGWTGKQYEFAKCGTRLVGEKCANAFGLFDMLGNVWEWCADWYALYPSSLVVDPRGPENGDGRVLRGGSWGDDARDVRAAYRSLYHPDGRFDSIGFRLARGP